MSDTKLCKQPGLKSTICAVSEKVTWFYDESKICFLQITNVGF